MELSNDNLLRGDDLRDPVEFRLSAERLAKEKSSLSFTSMSSINAAIVISTIIKYADNEVRLYDTCIDGEIADQEEHFFNVLEKFFDAGKKLKVVVRKEVDKESKIQSELERYEQRFPNQLELRIASNEFTENIRSAVQTDANFIVSDVYGFRMEMLNSDNDTITDAFSSFNKKDISERLISIFDEKYATCKELKFPAHA